MGLGFYNAYKAGISFGKDDMVIPGTKEKLVNETRELAKEYEQQYIDGLITQGEKYNKVVDAWAKCTDRVADEMMKQISSVQMDEETGREKPINSIYMMSHSGARGSPAQMKQLAGMRGLMAKPSGEIIETPIISNFKEGLTVLEYFNSTHGARKGLADTALKTANSGYLTRRLVDVAQDCIITTEDCGTKAAITARPIIDAGEVIASLGLRILGRTAADDIKDPAIGRRDRRGGQRDPGSACRGDREGRRPGSAHPLGADLRDQVRRLRQVLWSRSGPRHAGQYGRGGRRHRRAVDRRAGHPAHHAHLPYRRHGAGARPVLRRDRTTRARSGSATRTWSGTRSGKLIVMGRNVAIVVEDAKGNERAVHKVTYGTRLFVDEGDQVKRGTKLAEWDPYTRPIMTEADGTVEFEDVVEGVSVNEIADEATGITNRVIIDWRSNQRGSSLKPAIVIKDAEGKVAKLARGGEARYLLSVDAILSVDPGAKMKAGDVLARIPLESAKTRDITGGLPRVAELFEARRPKDHAIIAEISGRVEFGRDYKNKRRIRIVPQDESVEAVEYLIPKGKHLPVQEGDFIEKGEYILDGNPAPHDILAIKGVEELASYLVNEIQEVYRLQGVSINDKHIEVIVRQMLQKVEITSTGESTLLAGRATRPGRARRHQRQADRRRPQACVRRAGAARHHQGVAADTLLHLGGVVPGDDPRADRGVGRRQGRHARRPQGERHRRQAHPGRHRRHAVTLQAGGRPARHPHPGRAGQGQRSSARRRVSGEAI